MTQLIRAFGFASRMAATAGNVWTMSPNELGLMMRIDFRNQRPMLKSIGKQSRQAGLQDLLLRGVDIIFYAPLFDHVSFRIENAIGGTPIAIARLADASGVNEIFLCRLDRDLIDLQPLHAGIAHDRRRAREYAQKSKPSCADT